MSNVTGTRLKDKVAIVTGGASGFGRATSQRFISEGCKVIVADLNEDGAKETIAESTDEANGLALKMDVTSRDAWTNAVKEANAKWGRLDIIINNAGWSYKNKPTAEVTEAEFDRVFLINVKSIFWSVEAAVPELQKQGGGSIINIASIGASRPRPGLVWYNSSKGAVANASMGLAAEYGKDQIRVNSICPLLSNTGLFETFVGVKHTEENIKQFVAAVPLGRLTDPLDVANTALFLASEEGKFITGKSIEVDGGKGI